jgi:hypothetical protein
MDRCVADWYRVCRHMTGPKVAESSGEVSASVHFLRGLSRQKNFGTTGEYAYIIPLLFGKALGLVHSGN